MARTQEQQPDYSGYTVGELLEHTLSALRNEGDMARDEASRARARAAVDEMLTVTELWRASPDQHLQRAWTRLNRTVALARNRRTPLFHDGRPLSEAEADPEVGSEASRWIAQGRPEDLVLDILAPHSARATGGVDYNPLAAYLTGQKDDLVGEDLAGIPDVDNALESKLGLPPEVLNSPSMSNSSDLRRRALIYGLDAKEEDGRFYVDLPDGSRQPIPNLTPGRKMAATLSSGERIEFTVNEGIADAIEESRGTNFFGDTITGGVMNQAGRLYHSATDTAGNVHPMTVLTPYGRRRVPNITGNAAVDHDLYMRPEIQRGIEMSAEGNSFIFEAGKAAFAGIEFAGLMAATGVIGKKLVPALGKAATKAASLRALGGVAKAGHKMSDFAKMTGQALGGAAMEGAKSKTLVAPGLRMDARQLFEEVYYNVAVDVANGRWEFNTAVKDGASEWMGEYVLGGTARGMRRAFGRLMDTRFMREAAPQISKLAVGAEQDLFDAGLRSLNRAKSQGISKVEGAIEQGMFGEAGRVMRREFYGSMFDAAFTGHAFGAWTAGQRDAMAEGKTWETMTLADKAGYFMANLNDPYAIAQAVGMMGTQVAYTGATMRGAAPGFLLGGEAGAAEAARRLDDGRLSSGVKDMAEFIMHIARTQSGDLDPGVITLLDGAWDFGATNEEKAARLQKLAEMARGTLGKNEPELMARDIDATPGTASRDQLVSLVSRKGGTARLRLAYERLTNAELEAEKDRVRSYTMDVRSSMPEEVGKLRDIRMLIDDEIDRRRAGGTPTSKAIEEVEVEAVDEEGNPLEGEYGEEPAFEALPPVEDMKPDDVDSRFNEGRRDVEAAPGTGRAAQAKVWSVIPPAWRNQKRSKYRATEIVQQSSGNEVVLGINVGDEPAAQVFPNTDEGLRQAKQTALVLSGTVQAGDATLMAVGLQPRGDVARIQSGLLPRTKAGRALGRFLSNPKLQTLQNFIDLDELDANGDDKRGIQPGEINALVEALRADAKSRDDYVKMTERVLRDAQSQTYTIHELWKEFGLDSPDVEMLIEMGDLNPVLDNLFLKEEVRKVFAELNDAADPKAAKALRAKADKVVKQAESKAERVIKQAEAKARQLQREAKTAAAAQAKTLAVAVQANATIKEAVALAATARQIIKSAEMKANEVDFVMAELDKAIKRSKKSGLRKPVTAADMAKATEEIVKNSALVPEMNNMSPEERLMLFVPSEAETDLNVLNRSVSLSRSLRRASEKKYGKVPDKPRETVTSASGVAVKKARAQRSKAAAKEILVAAVEQGAPEAVQVAVAMDQAAKQEQVKVDPVAVASEPGVDPLKVQAAVELGASAFKSGKADLIGTDENPGPLLTAIRMSIQFEFEAASNPEARAKYDSFLAGALLGAGLPRLVKGEKSRAPFEVIADMFGTTPEHLEVLRSALEVMGGQLDPQIRQNLAKLVDQDGKRLISDSQIDANLGLFRTLAIAPDRALTDRGRAPVLQSEASTLLMDKWWKQTGRVEAIRSITEELIKAGQSNQAGNVPATVDAMWEKRMAGARKAIGKSIYLRGLNARVASVLAVNMLGKGQHNAGMDTKLPSLGDGVTLKYAAMAVTHSMRTGENLLVDTSNAPSEAEGQIIDTLQGERVKGMHVVNMGSDARMEERVAVEPAAQAAVGGDKPETPLEAAHRWFGVAKGYYDSIDAYMQALGFPPTENNVEMIKRLNDLRHILIGEGRLDPANVLGKQVFDAAIMASEGNPEAAVAFVTELQEAADKASSSSQEAVLWMVDAYERQTQGTKTRDTIELIFDVADYQSSGEYDHNKVLDLIDRANKFGVGVADEKNVYVPLHLSTNKQTGGTDIRVNPAAADKLMNRVMREFAEYTKIDPKSKQLYMFAGVPATEEEIRKTTRAAIQIVTGAFNFMTGHWERYFSGQRLFRLVDSSVDAPSKLSPKRILDSMARGDRFWSTKAGRAFEKMAAVFLKVYQGGVARKFGVNLLGVGEVGFVGYRGRRGLATEKVRESNAGSIDIHMDAAANAQHLLDRARRLLEQARDWNLNSSEARFLGDALANGAAVRFRSEAEFEKAMNRKGTGKYWGHIVEWNELMREMGREMVELGIIEPEAFETLEDKYMPRRFVQYATTVGGKDYFVSDSGASGSPLSAAEQKREYSHGAQFAEQIYDIRYTMPIAVAKAANRITMFRVLSQMQKAGHVLSRAEFDKLGALERGQYRKASDRGVGMTLGGKLLPRLTPEEQRAEASGELSQSDVRRILTERANTTLEAAMLQTVIDAERKARDTEGVMTKKLAKLFDDLEGGYITHHASREIGFLLERTENTGRSVGGNFEAITEMVQQATLEWRQLRTVQNPKHWMLQFMTNWMTNAATGKVPMGDMVQSIISGEGTYADAAYHLSTWWELKQRGVKTEDMPYEAAQFGRFVDKMGGATLSHMINDPVRPQDLQLSMFYGADGQPLFSGSNQSQVLETFGVAATGISRAGRGFGSMSGKVLTLGMSPNPAARAEAVRALLGVYNLHELWWKYAATIEGMKRGLSFDAAARWGAEGTGDFTDRNTTLMRTTTSFSTGISTVRDEAYAKLGYKRQGEGVNPRLLAKQLMSMGVATPFWMYRASMIPTMIRTQFTWKGITSATVMSLLIRAIDYGFGGDDEDLVEAMAGTDILRGVQLDDATIKILERRHGEVRLPGFAGGVDSASFGQTVKDWLRYVRGFGNNMAHVASIGTYSRHDPMGDMLTTARGPTIGGQSTSINMGDFIPLAAEVNDLSAGMIPILGMYIGEEGRIAQADARYGFGLMSHAVTAGVIDMIRLANGEKGKTTSETMADVLGQIAAQWTAPLGGSSILPAPFSREHQVLIGESGWDGRSVGQWAGGLPRPRGQSDFGEMAALLATRSLLPVTKVSTRSRAPGPDRGSSFAGVRLPNLASNDRFTRAGDERKTQIKAATINLLSRAYRESLDDVTIPHGARVSAYLDLNSDLVALPDGNYDVVTRPKTELGKWLRSRGETPEERQVWVKEATEAISDRRDMLDDLLSSIDGLVYRRDVDPALHDRMVRAAWESREGPQPMMRYLHQQLEDTTGNEGLISRLWVTLGMPDMATEFQGADYDRWRTTNDKVRKLSAGNVVDQDTAPTQEELRAILGPAVYDVDPQTAVQTMPRKSMGELKALFPNLLGKP